MVTGWKELAPALDSTASPQEPICFYLFLWLLLALFPVPWTVSGIDPIVRFTLLAGAFSLDVGTLAEEKIVCRCHC